MDIRPLFADAVRCHQAGRLKEAEGLYRRVLDAEPHHADSAHLLGIIAYQSGRLGLAADLIGRAIQVKDTVAAYHSNLGGVLKDLRRFGEAERHCRRALALNPSFAEAHNNLANVLKDIGRADEAFDAYKAALSHNPNFAEAHNNLGSLLESRGERAAAATSYGRAVELRPGYAEAHFNLGNLHKEDGRIEDAAAAYGRALQANPQFAAAHNNLATVLKEQGKVADATAHYMQALLFKPDYAAAHFNFGNALAEQGNAEEAIARYERALALEPRFAEAHNNLGNALRQQGRLEDAAAAFSRAATLKPAYSEAHYNLGDVLAELRKLAEAEACFARMRAIRPDDAAACGGLGNVLLLQGRTAEADALFREAHRLRPLGRRKAAKPKPDFAALVLNAPDAGNTPGGYLFDHVGFDTAFVTLLEGLDHDVAALRDAGDVVVNLVSDVDRAGAILPLAATLVEQIGRPVINHPAKVLKTARDVVAARLAGIPRTRIPKTLRLPGATLVSRGEIGGALQGLSFPLLVRPCGAHGGDLLERVSDVDALAAFAGRQREADYYVSEYVATESPDGHFRKYRLIFVGTEILPYHLAIVDQWKVHYFRTDMAHQSAMRAEEEAFLKAPTTVFGSAQWRALDAVRATIGLDYFGIDCALDRDGNVIVFEANATMLVHPERAVFAYKQPYIARIKQAFAALLAAHAGAIRQ